MAKRSAEDAGLNEPRNEENNEEHEEHEDELEQGIDNASNEGGSENGEHDDDDSDGSSDSTPDTEYLRGFALSWLEDKRLDGIAPQKIFESLGMKLKMDNLEVAEQWELLEKVVTSEGIARSIFRALFTNHRHKLPNINTFEDVIELIRTANNIVVLTGAGVSVSCGIPDFRSPGGLYAVIEAKYNLPEPQCLFDIHYLRDDPQPFFEFAREIFPGNHKPSPTHYFIKELAQRGKLLRNYTQNIDTLERVAGIEASKLVNCHGSFATASCMVCKRQVDGELIKDDIMSGTIPQCSTCINEEGSIMKPDIVFFGESLPDRFDDCLKEDCDKIDLLLVMGSSLKVKPVAYVPEVIKAEVPQILINKELVAQPHEFDFANLGDCDTFVLEVCRRLGWTLNGKSPDEYPTPIPISNPPLPTLTVPSSSSSPTPAAPVSDFASLHIPSEASLTPLSSVLPSPTLTPSLPSYDLANLDPIPSPPSILP